MKVDYLYNSWQFMLQQLVYMVGRGYYFYHVGKISEKKLDKAIDIDKKIINKYNINIDKYKRNRRKQKKLANFYYMRYHTTFIILHTDGRLDVELDDEFFDARIKQTEVNRLKIGASNGVSFNISLVHKERNQYKVTVSLSNETYKNFRTEIEEYIQQRQIKKLEEFFKRLRNLPAWKGIIKQEYLLLDEVYKYAKKYGLNSKKKNLIKYPKEYPDLNLYPLRINTYRKIYSSDYKSNETCEEDMQVTDIMPVAEEVTGLK